MVVDVGVVRNHIKPKADSTLYNMRKVDLIEYIRTLEHNYNVAVSFNENQAKYIESLGFKEVIHCKDCKHWYKQGICDKHTEVNAVWMDADDFCSKGEMIENEG